MMAYVIAYAYLFVLLVVSVAGILRYRKIDEGYLRALVHLVWFATLVESTSKLITVQLELTSLWLFNLIMPILLLLINRIYYKYFEEHRRIRQGIIISYLMFLLFYAANILYLQDFVDELCSHAIQLMALSIVIWVFLYFRLKLKHPESGDLEKDPMFWISSGLLFFYGAEIFSIGSINYYNRIGERDLGSVVTSIIQMINIPMNIMFFIAILCRTHPRTSS